MTIANVALTDTFDYWRTVTNSLVVAVDGNLLNFKTANANTVSLTSTGGRLANIYMNVVTTSSYTDVSSANIASTLAVNAVHGLAISWVAAANSNTQTSVTAANNYASILSSNNAIGANNWANTVGTAGNTYASILVANNAVGANTWANTKLANTSGVSFSGNLFFPNGNISIGTSTTRAPLGISRTVTALSGSSNDYGIYVYPTASGLCYIDALTGSSSASLLGFRTYNNGTYSEVRMDQNGYVGIGTNSPVYKLDVVGGIRASTAMYAPTFVDSNDNSYAVDPSGTSVINNVYTAAIWGDAFYQKGSTDYRCIPASTSRFLSLHLDNGSWLYSQPDNYYRIHFSNGNSTYLTGSSTSHYWIRFGTQDNQQRAIFEGAGNFYTTGNITAYWSDRRLKKNIVKIDNWRDIMNGINGYMFEWNDIGNKILENSEPGVQVGLIAQEVEKVLPQAAAVQMMQYKDKDGDVLTPRDDIDHDPENPYLTVREEKIIPVLVEAIKGLMAEIDDLKKRLP